MDTVSVMDTRSIYGQLLYLLGERAVVSMPPKATTAIYGSRSMYALYTRYKRYGNRTGILYEYYIRD